MISTNDLIAICSLVTNIIALILSYLTYKESRDYPIVTLHSIFRYEIYVVTMHFSNKYVTYAVLIVYYIA